MSHLSTLADMDIRLSYHKLSLSLSLSVCVCVCVRVLVCACVRSRLQIKNEKWNKVK